MPDAGLYLPRLPVQGFVLAGGKSSRMGQDKALLPFRGRPMVQIALEKLFRFCSAVAISGNRDDLGQLAPLVKETRLEAGPAAGMEAGLRSSSERWSLFLPVDAPLAPGDLLRRWAEAVLATEGRGVRLSFLRVEGVRQPAFCMLHVACVSPLVAALEDGERKLGIVYDRVARTLGPEALWIADAEPFAPARDSAKCDLARRFANLNTPADLAQLEAELDGPPETMVGE